MKKSTSTSHKNPISIKAYNEFKRRIRAVFCKPGDAEDVIHALDMYLDDDPQYGRCLNSRSVVGLSFLLFDVDMAVARSRRARERAAKRRAAREEERRAAEPAGEAEPSIDCGVATAGSRHSMVGVCRAIIRPRGCAPSASDGVPLAKTRASRKKKIVVK